MTKSMLLPLLAITAACGPSTVVKGTLVSPHPTGTVAMALGSQTRSEAPVGSNGRFAVTVPAGDVVRIRFAARHDGRMGILGSATESSSTRPIEIRSRSDRSSEIDLGDVGGDDQPLERPTSGDDCTDDGQPLRVENERPLTDGNVASAAPAAEHDDVCTAPASESSPTSEPTPASTEPAPTPAPESPQPLPSSPDAGTRP